MSSELQNGFDDVTLKHSCGNCLIEALELGTDLPEILMKSSCPTLWAPTDFLRVDRFILLCFQILKHSLGYYN